MVPTAKMRVAEAMASTAEMAMAATTEMAMASTTEMAAAEMAATSVAATAVTSASTAAVTSAAAPAESRARQQRRHDKDRNSDGRFRHGTLLHHAADAAALERRRKEAKVPFAEPARAYGKRAD